MSDRKSQQNVSFPVRSEEDRFNFLVKVAKSVDEKGLDSIAEDFDLEKEYEEGLLHEEEDIDWLLLEVLNQSDEVDKERKFSSEVMRDMIERRKFGEKFDVQDLVRGILSRTVLGKIVSSVPGRLACKCGKVPSFLNFFRETIGHREVKEKDGSNMKYVKKEFKNWGLTVDTNTICIFVPKSKEGICNLVKWAKKKSLKVRASGYRHSWSDITVNNGQVLVSMIPLRKAGNVPSFATDIDPENELEGIDLVGDIEEDGVKKKLCKIGAATTNEQFRKWVIKNSEPGKEGEAWNDFWTIPLNVILVESTFGGSNAVMCHGSGLKNETLSDLVAAIEFVNANGELQVVDDPDQLKSAAGCFGMLGIVTSLTLKLDPLTFARMIPSKKRLALTIPPPLGFEIPDGVDMKDITDEMLTEAFEEFKDSCENDYYVQYMWFPSQKKCWVNNWKNDGDAKEAIDYPSPTKAFLQGTSTFISNLANNTLFRNLPGSLQLFTLTTFAMAILPEKTKTDAIVTPLIDALHFQRGIHNMRVYNMEWEIPIPGLKSDPLKPDWSVCQKAWWAVIKMFYDRFNNDRNDVPLRLPLEMRIMGGSSVHLSPQNGNIHGTCSIEILTPANVDRDEWVDFLQEVTDAWVNLTDDDGKPIHPFDNGNGRMVYPRIHWAKEWEGLKVKDQPIKAYHRDTACKAQIERFVGGLDAIAKDGRYTLKDAEDMFSTAFTREMFPVPSE